MFRSVCSKVAFTLCGLFLNVLGTVSGMTQPTTISCFETFPFPEGLTPNIPAAQYADDPRAVRIANVARRLNERREAWLNPPDLVIRVPEVVPGYPIASFPRTSARRRS